MAQHRILASTAALAIVYLLASNPAFAKKYPWERPPGPIAGTWRVTCADSVGMTVRVTVTGKVASGVVAKVGAARRFGYRPGEQIFKNLKANYEGRWRGSLKWRDVSGTVRWDPIFFAASATKLHAVQTTDKCYRNMPRVK